MAHNLECKDGSWSFAFTGSRNAIWHKLGQQLPEGATIEECIAASGFN